MQNQDTEARQENYIELKGVWKIFGRNAPHVLHSLSSEGECSKKAILEQTGCVIALRDVSFSIRKGELFVIMGLSGSGKSTLIRCCLRLIEPSSGKILIDGADICQFNDNELMRLRREKISMIFQNFGIFPHRNVLDNVAYGLKIRGISREERYARSREVLAKVGLAGWENRFPSDLSGGMLQRVGTARAMANDPEILLMDEPFSALDPLIRREMQNEYLALHGEFQKTVIFVTHDLDEALRLGNRIAIMKDGEIIQIGTPGEVVSTPRDAYVRAFVRDVSPAKVLLARDIMEQPGILLHEQQGRSEAMNLLKTAQQNYAFLVSDHGKLLGIVTMRRLMDLTSANDTPLKKACEDDVATCSSHTVVQDLFPLATSTPYPIAVVDRGGELLGEINARMLLACMSRGKEVSHV